MKNNPQCDLHIFYEYKHLFSLLVVVVSKECGGEGIDFR